MASSIARKLHEQGHEVIWHSEQVCLEPLRDCKFISTLATPVAKEPEGPDVDLDNAYELKDSQTRARISVPRLFIQSAVPQLRKIGVDLEFPFSNLTPQLTAPSEGARLKKLSGPLIAVIPKSSFWLNRTISERQWESFANEFPSSSGTLIWCGLDPAPAGFHDPSIRSLSRLMKVLDQCDLVVSVDTGPMHMAAALGRPLIVIEQSVDPALRLTDQVDFSVFQPRLGCLGCAEFKCPINKEKPPCHDVPLDGLIPMILARTIRHKVSAIIPVYKPDAQRLKKCVTSIMPQVDEIVVVIDGDGIIKPDLPTHPTIRYVSNKSGARRGYGKTVNLGCRHSTGEFMLMLNDDVMLAPGAVEHMISEMNDGVAVAGCLLRYPDGTIQHGGTSRNHNGFYHIDHRKRRPTIQQPKEMDFVTFAAALVRRSDFYKMRGFDERFDCYYEDSDLCLRLKKEGRKVMYTPYAEGVHDESQTTGPIKQSLIERGSSLFRRLHLTN